MLIILFLSVLNSYKSVPHECPYSYKSSLCVGVTVLPVLAIWSHIAQPCLRYFPECFYGEVVSPDRSRSGTCIVLLWCLREGNCGGASCLLPVLHRFSHPLALWVTFQLCLVSVGTVLFDKLHLYCWIWWYRPWLFGWFHITPTGSQVCE